MVNSYAKHISENIYPVFASAMYKSRICKPENYMYSQNLEHAFRPPGPQQALTRVRVGINGTAAKTYLVSLVAKCARGYRQ
jgi:hypothetical protein